MIAIIFYTFGMKVSSSRMINSMNNHLYFLHYVRRKIDLLTKVEWIQWRLYHYNVLMMFSGFQKKKTTKTAIKHEIKLWQNSLFQTQQKFWTKSRGKLKKSYWTKSCRHEKQQKTLLFFSRLYFFIFHLYVTTHSGVTIIKNTQKKKVLKISFLN